MARPANQNRGDTPEQLQRAIWLDGEIRSRQYPSVAALMEKFEVSRRTAFNTVKFLKYSLNAPVKYDGPRKGYHYTDPTYGLPTVFLRDGELLALLVAQQVSAQYAGSPLEAALREAIAKITRYLPDRVRVDLSEVADRFQFAGGSTLEVPMDLFLAVRRAIREQRPMRVVYYTASRGETAEREIEPHFLQNVRGDWMVVAWDWTRDADRVFMLARIREWEVLPGTFTPRPELDPAIYNEATFLTEHGSEAKEVVLRFDAYQARWIRERRWHPSQSIEELPDGELILRLRVAGEEDLLRWVLGYGSHVEVLAPEKLRTRVAEELEKARVQYSSDGPAP